MTPPTTILFVYGTLMRGECNHALLGGARYLGAATTRPEHELISMGWHPAMLHGGAVAVHGEVYDVSPAALAEIDRLEDHPHWYRREPIRLADGRDAETYLLPRAGQESAPRIASGDWRLRSP